MKRKFYKSVLMIPMLIGTLWANAQAPALNSYTPASAVIFLDFNGFTVSGTMWNVYGPFTCKSSGLDSAQITEVFNRVAEDFRPFKINITTSEAKYNQAPANKRIRVVITASYEWYGSGAGGVAYLNSFKWGDETPAFVFSSLIGFNPKNIAEIVSHETGHTLGLRHQSIYDASCNKISDYNPGKGNGEIGWAPIMGVSYNENMTLWHNGPNSTGCDKYQNDLSIISNTTNGFGFREDDYSDAFADADKVIFNNNQQLTINGVIEQTNDKDLFKFTLPAFSKFRLNAVPYNVGTGNAGSDLDMKVELIDNSHNTIGTYNPGNLLNSVIDTFLNSGTYYIKVGNTENMFAPQYASLGSYSLLGSYTDASSIRVRKFELKGQLEKGVHALNWLIEADRAVIKQVVEISSDETNFVELNRPESSVRVYNYIPAEDKPLRYRIHATFDNNKEYFSNTITIRQSVAAKPKLVSNIITGNSVSISSPDVYHYQIMNQSGKMLSRGIVSKGFGSVETGNVAAGIYIIRFSNGNEHSAEKFVKE